MKLFETTPSNEIMKTLSDISKIYPDYFLDKSISTILISLIFDHRVNINNNLKGFPEPFIDSLKIISILLNPSSSNVDICNVDFMYEFTGLVTGNWLVKFLPNYYTKLSELDIDEDMLVMAFERLDKLATFDIRKGIKTYGCYVSYFGINNIMPYINNLVYRDAMIGIDINGSVYKDMKAIIGDDLDYIIQLCQLRGLENDE